MHGVTMKIKKKHNFTLLSLQIIPDRSLNLFSKQRGIKCQKHFNLNCLCQRNYNFCFLLQDSKDDAEFLCNKALI